MNESTLNFKISSKMPNFYSEKCFKSRKQVNSNAGHFAFALAGCQPDRSQLRLVVTLNSPGEHEHASWTWISPFSFRKCQKPPKQIKSTSSNSLFTSLTSLQSGRIRRNKLHVDPFSTGISSHMRIIQSSNIFITPRVMIMQQQTRVICTVLLALPADLLKIKRFTKRNVM